jgi:hypothetical protein
MSSWVPGTGRDIAPPAIHACSPSRRDVPEVAWRLDLPAEPVFPRLEVEADAP